MKLCILGPESKKDYHLRLIELSKYHFDKVLYAPLSGVRIEREGEEFTPYYKSASLYTFDVVLPLIPKSLAHFGYAVVSLLEEHGIFTPISNRFISHASNPFLIALLNQKLGNADSPIRVYLSVSRDALNAILPKLNYPVRVYIPEAKKQASATFESEASLKSFLDTIELLAQPIILEEIKTSKNLREMDVLTIGNRIFAVQKVGNEKRRCRTSKHIQGFVLRMGKILKTSIFQARIIVEKNSMFVKSLNTSPALSRFEDVFGKGMVEDLIAFLSKECEEFYRRHALLTFVDRLVEHLRTMGGRHFSKR